MILSSYHKVIVILLSVLFLPSLVYVVFQSSSLALGLITSLFILLVLVNKNKLPKIKNQITYVFIMLFLLQYIYLFFSEDSFIFEKQTVSFIIFLLMILSAAFFSREIKRVSSKELVSFIKWLSVLIIGLGILSRIVTIESLHYINFPKNVFPFSEPSHYVLATGGILFSFGLFIGSRQRIYLLTVLIFLTILFPSTLLLVLTMLMLIIYYSGNIKKIIFLITILIVAAYFISNNIGEFNYFSSRLNTSSTNHNLTTLVYFQGLDDAYRSLIATNGVGLGFQNMGSLPPSDISELIYSLSGYYKNRNDGGFLASKIIGEFGVIGILMLLYYLFQFYKSFLFLRRVSGNKLILQNIPSQLILAHSIIVVFFLEVFVRGYGYFSPGVFFVLLSLFIVRKRTQ